MRMKLALSFALCLLTGAALAADKEKTEPAVPFKPAVVARLAPLDDLIADLRYIVKLAGREEEAKQVEALLKARTGPKGLEGVDTRKAIGIYAVVEKQVNASQIVFLLPIADKKTFLTFLENLDLKPEEQKDGSYSLTVENIPTGPLLLRFAHGYLYAMPRLNEKQTIPVETKLPRPETVLKGKGAFSLAVNIDAIPTQVRKLAVSGLALQLGNLKDEKQPGETEKQTALREAILDEVAAQAKALLEDGQALSLNLALDRKAHDLSLGAKLTAKKDTALAKDLARRGKAEGLGAALMSQNQVLGGYIRLTQPEAVAKAMGPAIDEAVAAGLKALPEDQRKLIEPLAKSLSATLKSDTLDLGVGLRGPGKDGKYTFVTGMRIKEGDKIEKSLKDTLPNAPDEIKKLVKFDVAKANSINIHQVAQKLDDNSKQVLGEGPLYLALRKDAVIGALGENGLDALKGSLTAKPKAGDLLHLEVSMAALAPLLKDRKGAPEAAKKAFKGKGDDKVTLRLSAGSALELKLTVKTAVLTFAGLLDKAEEK